MSPRPSLTALALLCPWLLLAACSGSEDAAENPGEPGLPTAGKAGAAGKPAGAAGVAGQGVAGSGQAGQGEAGQGGGSGGQATAGASGSPSTGGQAGQGGGSGGSGGSGELCPKEGLNPKNGARLFNGQDSAVSMGKAPALGLTTFTVEAWVRRDGAGVTTNTGADGITLVPIAGKGRGENDQTVKNCNYALGFVGDRLGADFEDMTDGGNHPIVSHKKIPLGEWHHVAASYDGTTWRLFLDGVLDATSKVSATPRSDSVQHFGIGTTYNSEGVAAGFFHGAIDEVRVWNVARSEAQIAQSLYQSIETAEGLVGRWSLDEDGPTAVDSAGDLDGTVTAATSLHPAAPLDIGLPPTLLMAAPQAKASVKTDATLSLSLDDPDSSAFSATFYLRRITGKDDFTVVVLPDTQYYTVEAKNLEKYFYDQTKWVVDNREEYNIVAVIHNGDITDHGNKFEYEWKVADKAMKTIEAAQPGLPEGLPWAVTVGNHDNSFTFDETKLYNQYFGISRFAKRSYYGGHYGNDNDENWMSFAAGGLDFVVVNLQYDVTPKKAILDWGRSVFDAQPDAFGILNSHYIVNSNGNFGDQGKATYERLKDAPNVHLMTNGHVSAEARRKDSFEGHTIHSMLADYQGRANGGSGWMRIWEFSPQNDQLTVRTYSPTLKKWETDDDSEFTIPVPLTGSGGAFAEVGTVSGSKLLQSPALPDLVAGATYEWYARIEDCGHRVNTPVYRFVTQP